jgi:hypothetical protein
MVGEGFAVTCSDDEALKLIEDSAVTVEHIVGFRVVILNTLHHFLHVIVLS